MALAGKPRASGMVVGGMLSASGVDAKGRWALSYTGVPVRLREDEAVELAFGAWLEGRHYLASFDEAVLGFREWSDADPAGVRWPLATHWKEASGSESLDLFQNWAAVHGFPGPRPTYTFRQQSEVGDSQADEKRIRPATFEFGPIHLTEPLVAVVFDIENRTLWLEPPCDRDLPEDLSGWVLERKDSTAYPDHPWVARFVIPGGSADLAGVKAGDRILHLGSRAAILELSTFESVTKQVSGDEGPCRHRARR